MSVDRANLLIIQSVGDIMGSLTPGATLVYERVGGTVYAREFGQVERTIVGYDYTRDLLDHRNYMSNPKESQLWHEIRLASETNTTIKSLLEQAKTAYYLSKELDARYKTRT
jgi:hypothetical protein